MQSVDSASLLKKANAHHQAGRLAEAEAAHQRVLRAEPTNANALHLLGAALAVKPDHAEAHWRLSQVLLVLGDYEAAWPHAGWDAKVSFLPRNPSFPRPQWDGSDLHGKTILLHTTQGIGDTIQFIRYVPLVAERGGRVVLYSLQKGAAAAQLASSPLGSKLIDLAPQLNDFADTAAAIANLDLVISVDTSVAHLAGAMGKPVWMLLPFAPDWRWMLDRADTPWYPTMRLFRQPALRDWAGAVDEIARAICM